ncbi:pyocin activator PrtN family protein [Acinetobacter sp. ESBL14]|uniref:pyocin activator PrtN family protein n=1 Tax=Acinetobacter sp. ESBL14 TaxID=3077329 RepID=UPI002FC59423
MGVPEFSTEDYLFMRYRSIVVKLDDLCSDYYPHLQKKVINEKASKQDFPFPCFKLDGSQKSPWFVHLNEFANALDKRHELALKDFSTLHR